MKQIILALVIISLLAGCASNATTDTAARRPNVVFVLCDDLRWDSLGIAGHPHLKTPHIDRLAKEGVYFRNSFCTTSLCSPSRASILSGLYAHSHGVQNNFTEYPKSLASFPRLLQSIGYDTAYIGKWHMGEDNDEPRPGFDYFVTHKGQGKYFDTEFNLNGKERKVVKGYYTHVVTDMATEWLSRKRPENQPFLLMLGQKAPHSFYFPEPKYEHSFDHVKIDYPDTAFKLDDKPDWIKQRLDTWHGIYGPLFDYRKKFPDRSPEAVKDFAAMTRAYWGTIQSVDDSVGRLYKKLEEMGELDNTVFIFMGDNGLLNGEHGMVDKRTMHEASIRVPLVVRMPWNRGMWGPANPQAERDGTFNQPHLVDQQVLTIDMAPSILDVCKAPVLPNIHGRSFAPLVRDTRGWPSGPIVVVDEQGRRLGLEAPRSWRTSWYYEYNYEKQFPYTPNVRGVRTDDFKYIHYPHGDGSPDKHTAELYDIKNDPEERRNLIDDPKHAAKVVELKAELARLMREAGGLPDKMPVDEGIKANLPDAKIR